MIKIGITEGSDAALDNRWHKWVKDGKPAILITKDPEKLFNQLKDFKDPNIIIHCTITGNGNTILEPNVPKPDISLDYWYQLYQKYGKDRVVLRIDPIIPKMPYLQNSYQVLEKAKILTTDFRVRISIYDNYRHAEQRLKDSGIDLGYENFHYPLHARKNIWRNMGCPDCCGEPGIPSVPCLSEKDCLILGVEPGISEKWQRKECSCLNNKHELTPAKKPCPHNCKYCFWKNKK